MALRKNEKSSGLFVMQNLIVVGKDFSPTTTKLKNIKEIHLTNRKKEAGT